MLRPGPGARGPLQLLLARRLGAAAAVGGVLAAAGMQISTAGPDDVIRDVAAEDANESGAAEQLVTAIGTAPVGLAPKRRVDTNVVTGRILVDELRIIEGGRAERPAVFQTPPRPDMYSRRLRLRRRAGVGGRGRIRAAVCL